MQKTFRPQDIKAIIFDLGGVLGADAPTDFREQLAVRELIDLDEVNSTWRKHVPPLNLGKITEDQFWNAFISDLNIGLPPEHLLERFKKEFHLFLVLDKDFLDYLKEFKQELIKARPRSTMKFGILSNNVKEWLVVTTPQYDLPSVFDSILYSCNEGMAKPDPAFFKKSLQALGVEPDQVLFVDNKPSNVEAAKALGMYGLVFSTPEDFKKIMVELKMIKA